MKENNTNKTIPLSLVVTQWSALDVTDFANLEWLPAAFVEIVIFFSES